MTRLQRRRAARSRRNRRLLWVALGGFTAAAVMFAVAGSFVVAALCAVGAAAAVAALVAVAADQTGRTDRSLERRDRDRGRR